MIDGKCSECGGVVEAVKDDTEFYECIKCGSTDAYGY